MVAKIASGKYIRGALSYNENKVTQGSADCIEAVNYPLNHDQMTFKQKLYRLADQAALNEDVQHKCVHISLNFDPSEQFTNEQLVAIAKSYMEKLGFADQPYLIYNHTDSAHPHLHIVTTSIKENGDYIRLHNLAQLKSEPARLGVEREFNLVPAQSKMQRLLDIPAPANLGKIVHSKAETKATISNIVRSVYKNYRFTSFEQFNAVLRQFHILADRGQPGTKMYENQGLQYFLDVAEQLRVPIKASSIYDQPTLKNITKKFEKNKRLKEKFKGRVCRIIDDLLSESPNITKFSEQLEGYGILALFRQNADGRIFGITYIDNKTHCVFNGSELGKQYSAKQLLNRLDQNHTQNEKASSTISGIIKNRHSSQFESKSQSDKYMLMETLAVEMPEHLMKNILDDLLDAENSNDYISSELLKEAKKKTRRRRG